MRFNLGLCGPSNNASSQNTAAQGQIQNAYAQALAHLQQYLQQNPFPLQNIKPPAAAPQTGQTMLGGGQNFGGAHGGLMDVLAKAQKPKKGQP